MSKKDRHIRKGGYVRSWEEILASAAYRDLKPVSRCLLIELQRIYRPRRNGKISLSILNAKKLLHCHKDTASKAFAELSSHGFIKMTKGSWWQQRQSREWRLTFEMCDGREPTDEWKSWKKKTSPPLEESNNSRSQIKGQHYPNQRDKVGLNLGNNHVFRSL